jgi:hypothetical protein
MIEIRKTKIFAKDKSTQAKDIKTALRPAKNL